MTTENALNVSKSQFSPNAILQLPSTISSIVLNTYWNIAKLNVIARNIQGAAAIFGKFYTY